MASTPAGGLVRLYAGNSASLARLFAWDAPFLPVVTDVTVGLDGVTLECAAAGVTLHQACRWPRGQRAAVALQLVALGAFLFERGWYPSRALLRRCRVARGDDGVWLRLAEPPRWRIDDRRLEGRLRSVFGAEEAVLARTAGPLLHALLPERFADMERALRSRPTWETAAAWLGVLLGEGREGPALRHPEGGGRALWARRFHLPDAGVFWVEEEGRLPGLLVATRLLAAERSVIVVTGALEEEDVARAQARAAAAGHDLLALTTLSLPGVMSLPLAGGIEAVWVLAERGESGCAHAGAAVEVGAKRPSLAGAFLESGARRGFSRPPEPLAVAREHEALASPAARRALSWLSSAPVGLHAAELGTLAGTPETALPEIERLRLAEQRSGAWRAVQLADTPETEKLEAMAERLPVGSPAGLVARALARGECDALADWCEQRLVRGEAWQALKVSRPVLGSPAVSLATAEAALALGRLAEAERALDGVAEGKRGPIWHALAAWWAEQTGLPERATAELAAVKRASVPAHVAARCAMVAAELARRRGDREGEERHLRQAVTAAEPPLAEAELALAAFQGPVALRELRRARASQWSGDLKARALHLSGLVAYSRQAWAAAATALRAALRVATGENPRLLGEIHADLGSAAMLAERPGVADRHLKLAEVILERCGSRRAATVVRANRAVLACDRLDWRQARELTLAARETRGSPDDPATWLGELELARAELARGDTATVQALLPGLKEAVRHHGDHPVLPEALAGLVAHLALAQGDLQAAATAARSAEDGERTLVEAVVTADEGVNPSVALPQRWGMTVTAQLLAGWRRGEAKQSRVWLLRALDRTPREAAVGLARFVALLARRGERPGSAWADCERRAEAVLAAAKLDGWAALLRSSCGLDPVRVVEALDGIVNAGTDALAPPRLEALGRALGLGWFALERAGKTLAAWGTPSGETVEFETDGTSVRVGGGVDEVVRAALALLARHATARHDGEPFAGEPGGEALLGGSAALQSVRDQIARWGPLPLTVLVTGEPGTGKELVARELHKAARRRGAFVPINCAGIPASLLEAELFGVTRGAFTGADRDRAGLVEAAEDGTLFLDEVGELPLELQGKLLRLLQEREVRRIGATRSRVVDVRFLAATNRDLEAAVAAGHFRQDLFYRLAVAIIAVPPLRERPDDIEELARSFARRFSATLNRPGVRLAPAALAMLRLGEWPGNVRELESAVARAVAAARPGEVLGPDRFPGFAPAAGSAPAPPLAAWPTAVDRFRRTYFTELLQACGGNRSRAARQAGISRQTLLYHLRELGIRGDRDG